MPDWSGEVVVDSTQSLWVLFLRLGIAALLGGIIGLEREWKAHAAGLRTHMLVSLAAAVFALLTLEVLQHPMLQHDRVRIDPLRVIEAVTAGVAFLAAGAIIQSRHHVRGLTTGAGLWLAGALGAACGLGYLGIAVIATFFGLVIMSVLRLVERSLESEQKKREGAPPPEPPPEPPRNE